MDFVVADDASILVQRAFRLLPQWLWAKMVAAVAGESMEIQPDQVSKSGCLCTLKWSVSATGKIRDRTY